MSKRRKFSAEFKRGAVEQASQPGVSCAQMARELGIRDTLLTRWKREAQSQGAVAFGGAGTPNFSFKDFPDSDICFRYDNSKETWSVGKTPKNVCQSCSLKSNGT